MRQSSDGGKRVSSEYSKGPDFYAAKAKREGYPARSVYKLKEIHEKYRLIRKGMRVLDVGAFPGSWTLFALEVLGSSGRVVAIDLKKLALPRRAENLVVLAGDILDPTAAARIAEAGPYDLVLSDAAPDTTGNRLVDASRSAEIVSAVLELASRTLVAGGAALVKLFQGGEEQAILKTMRSMFESARTVKPAASRSISFETYCLGMGFRRERGDR